jgi:molybdopterin-guanine dinucleotide biosynthesis protein A
MKDHLEEGISKFPGSIPAGSPIVCESNSARLVVDPGLFLMTKRKDENECKTSAREVFDLADRIISFDGSGFDLNMDDVSFCDGHWALRECAAAIILAGGKSSRMGADKSFLPIQGKPMIQRLYENLRGNFDEVLISSSEPDKYAFLGVRVIPDRFPEHGPLMGIASAMEASSNERNFIIACDIPDPNIRLARKMLIESEGCDAVVPVFGNDRMEPLFAVYKKNLLPLIQETLSLGKRRIRDFFEFCNVKNLKMDGSEAIENINTMEDYKEYKNDIL